MQMTELDPQNISAAAGVIPENTPFVMLNLLRYKQHADYGDRTDFGPRSGREAYHQGYRPAFGEVAARLESAKGIRPLFLGTVLASLVGPTDEPWDEVALVEYPSFAAFRSITESLEYKRDAAPHREAALENWRLIAMLSQSLS
ncbi:MAG: hypothetical protein H0U76_14665 [Ktedonobacteraceae bacterium]|nr:hypothetical protein [Ktedonobacteraceae bacterium]